VVSAL
jgi:hypothetical protein